MHAGRPEPNLNEKGQAAGASPKELTLKAYLMLSI
jgi:hypothetical protein